MHAATIDEEIFKTCSLSLWLLVVPPDINEGPFEPQPDPITPGDKTVQIGTPVYVLGRNDVSIVCDIASGAPPITIRWFINGMEDTSFENLSTITITDVCADDDRDMYMCRAENDNGFDEETTTINVFGEY